MYKSLGFCWEAIWSPASRPLLLGNSKNSSTVTLTKPQLEWLSSSTMCNLFYQGNTKLLSMHTILAFLVFMPPYLQETPSCYNLSHPLHSCRTSLCSFFFQCQGLAGFHLMWFVQSLIMHLQDARCMNSFSNRSAGWGLYCIVQLYCKKKKKGKVSGQREGHRPQEWGYQLFQKIIPTDL